ncbi:MAG: helix-turn-helix domain-containing protein, partial [Nitrospira sp.]|nr:helix-turn-helix domain-containing protein [Nitrospira sp.]
MPLEDDCCDILKKARAGLGLSVGEVSQRAGLPDGVIAALERGDQARDRADHLALAKALGLRG